MCVEGLGVAVGRVGKCFPCLYRCYRIDCLKTFPLILINWQNTNCCPTIISRRSGRVNGGTAKEIFWSLVIWDPPFMAKERVTSLLLFFSDHHWQRCVFGPLFQGVTRETNLASLLTKPGIWRFVLELWMAFTDSWPSTYLSRDRPLPAQDLALQLHPHFTLQGPWQLLPSFVYLGMVWALGHCSPLCSCVSCVPQN